MTDRLYCEKYRAYISTANCLARIHSIDGQQWDNADPVCQKCEEYLKIEKRQAELRQLKADLIELAGLLRSMADRILKLIEVDDA